MARSSSTTSAATPSPTLATRYLLLYNSTSLLLWGVLLLRLLALLLQQSVPPSSIHSYLGAYTRGIQTLAVLEILHSLVGVVRAPLFTTIMQVSSRLFLVHAIVAPFPQSAGTGNPFYASMLFAWSVTEVVRYAFFANGLWAQIQGQGGNGNGGEAGILAKALTWARYNTFFVLYPIGIGSEVMCIWKAMGEMQVRSYGQVAISGAGVYGLAWWGCVLVLAIYVPGSWVLYTYMMKQRRKVFLGGGRKDSAAVARKETKKSK